MIKSRSYLVCLLIVVLAAALPSCRKYPNAKNVDNALEQLEAAAPSMNDDPLKILLHIHGHGRFAKVVNPMSGESTGAAAFLGSGAGARGWAVMRDDITLPEIVPIVQGATVDPYPDMFLAILVHAGVDPAQFTLTTTTGEAPSLRDYISSSLRDMDPLDLNDAEYQPGPGGNALGWTLLMLADLGATEAYWDMGPAGRLSFQDLLPLAMERPLDWGACTGLDEHFGLARAVYVHRAAIKKDKQTEFDAPLTGEWGRAGARLDAVVATARKNQRKDGSFDAGWSGNAAGAANVADRARHTARMIAILCMTQPAKALSEPWVTEAVRALTGMVLTNIDLLKKEPYALNYSAHALRLYKGRMTGKMGDAPAPCQGAACSYMWTKP